jgi:hypothetical protein
MAGASAYRSGMRSVGTVPNMPPSADARTYPATLDDMWDVGPWQELAGDRWASAPGRQCSDYALYLCAADPDCPGGFACKGRMCSNDLARKCASAQDCAAGGACQGICMDAAAECRRHDDCADGVSMCSGVGTCEPPALVLLNKLPVNASLLMQTASQCPAGSTPYLGETGMEMQFRDGASGAVLAECRDTEIGRKYAAELNAGAAQAAQTWANGYMSSFQSWGYAKAAFNKWSMLVAKRVADLQQIQPTQ